MPLGRVALVGAIVRWALRLRFPVLLGLTVALLAVNLVVPDPLPMVDEILLALGAMVLSRLRKRGGEQTEARQELEGPKG